ncbi:MAG: HEAT repeat domain-containing protein [Planctomycetota bacterium]
MFKQLRSVSFLVFIVAFESAALCAPPPIYIHSFIHGGGHAPPAPPPPPPGPARPAPTPGPGPVIPTPPHPQPGGPKTPGPSSPAPTGPTTPAPTGPTTPAPSGPRTPAPVPTGPMTPGLDTGPNLESWTYWWAFNKERFLKLREKIGKLDGPVTGGEGDDLLSGGRVSSMHATKEQLANEVTPVLLEILNNEKEALILNAAMISLAKIGERAPEVCSKLKSLLSHSNTSVVENSALSLGILGSPDAISILRSVYLDDEEGRKLCGNKSEVPWRVRTVAAYGLGLAGAHTKNPHHLKTIRETLATPFISKDNRRASERDVAVASILAIGMFPDPERVSASILERYFLDHLEREEIVCAHVPSSIAKIYATAGATERERFAKSLIQTLNPGSANGGNPNSAGKGAPRLARSGIAIALGMVTQISDTFSPFVIQTLRNSVEQQLSKYPDAAFMSIIALGEIAGTADSAADIEKYLLDRVSASGGRVTTRAWSAIALGISGYKQNERAGSARALEASSGKDPIVKVLEERMFEIKDPEQRSAIAIALGLRGAKGASGSFMKCLIDVKVDDVRGFFATALGLVGARDSAPALLTFLKDNLRRPAVFQQCAIGLGLMGEKAVVPVLIDVLRDSKNKSFIIQSAVADSLGYVGDYRAVGSLIDVVKDPKKEFTTSARTFGAVALGLIGDKDMEPWNARISTNLNYFAFVETLNDLIWEQ